MSTYERSGKPDVPQWWLDKVIPLLQSKDVKLAEVAAAASRHAGRTSPWKSDAVSKFATGKVRTIEMANGISAALGVPQPFFVAPTEAAASSMMLILQSSLAHQDSRDRDRRSEKVQLLSDSDRVLDGEILSAAAELKRAPAVPSSAHGEKGGRGVRARRAGRSRT